MIMTTKLIFPKLNSSGSILAVIFALLLASVIFFTNLGKYPLFNPDEALYAEPALEMLKSHDYITTSLNYVTRFTKPPLDIWAMVLSYKIFGINEFAARFPGAAAGYLTLIFTTIFTYKYLNKKTALWLCLILSQTPLFIAISRQAITDMPLTLFITIAVINFYTSLKEAKTPYLSFIMIGLAIMTKGPVGLVLPGLSLSIFYLLKGELIIVFKKINIVKASLIILGLALPWYIMEIYITNGAYFKEFIIRENFQRFTGVVDAHKGQSWYHLVVFCLGFLPWSIFFPVILAKIFKDFKLRNNYFTGIKAIKNLIITIPIKINNLIQQNPDLEIILLCLIQLVVTIAFFSISVSKLIPYTLPAYPFAAILLSYYLPKLTNKEFIGSCTFLNIIFGASYFILPKYFYKLRDTTPQINDFILNYLAIGFMATLICLVLSFNKQKKISIIMFCLFSILSITYFGFTGYGLISNIWELPIKNFAVALSNNQVPILIYDLRKPSIMFYAKRKILIPLNYQQFINCLKLNHQAYIISKTKNISTLSQFPKIKLLTTDGLFSLFYYQN